MHAYRNAAKEIMSVETLSSFPDLRWRNNQVFYKIRALYIFLNLILSGDCEVVSFRHHNQPSFS